MKIMKAFEKIQEEKKKILTKMDDKKREFDKHSEAVLEMISDLDMGLG